MAQMKTQAHQRNKVPNDVAGLLKNFDQQSVQISHNDAIDRCFVISAVLEGRDMQDHKGQNNGTLNRHGF